MDVPSSLTNIFFKDISDAIRIIMINGSSGVSLFLVLSAFLFTLITKGGEKEIFYSRFLINRILRIFPLMIVVVFVVITIDRGNSTPLDIFRIITLQLNTGNPITGWGHNIFPIGPIWTIAVEFQFYLIFPFLISFLYKNGIFQFICMILFFILLRLLIVILTSPDIYYNFYHTILGRIDQFLIGMILGRLYVKGKFNINNMQCILLFIFSMVFLNILFKLNYNMEFRSVLSFPIEAICWSVIIISFLSFRIKNVLLVKIGTIVSFLGTLSFSMYLLHLPVGLAINKVFHLVEPSSISESILQTCFRLLFIIPLAWLSYVAIEKPFMSLRVKYLKLEE